MSNTLAITLSCVALCCYLNSQVCGYIKTYAVYKFLLYKLAFIFYFKISNNLSNFRSSLWDWEAGVKLNRFYNHSSKTCKITGMEYLNPQEAEKSLLAIATGF